MSSARGGGSTCREKLLEVIKFLLGDWITIVDKGVLASFARGVLELRLAASAAGKLFDVKVVELLRSAGVAGSSVGRAPFLLSLLLLLLDEDFRTPGTSAASRLGRDDGDWHICFLAPSGSSIPEALASFGC
jgi:hypothetical protein